MTGLKGAILAGVVLTTGIVVSAVEQHLPSSKTRLCTDNVEHRDKAIALATEALDSALLRQVEHLFEVWMKDDTGQPQRAAQGARNAVAAYLHARIQVEGMSIPPCKETPK